MMQSTSAIKVGVMVLVAAGLLFAGWVFFGHLDLDHYKLYAVFNDTRGLQKQSPLRMNGVTIGEVADVQLQSGTLKPVVTLAVNNRFKDKIPRDSRIRITSGLLITTPQIEVDPGSPSAPTLKPGQWWPAEYVQAEPAGALASVSPEADQAVKQLSVTVKTLTPKLDKAMDNLLVGLTQFQGILKRADATMANFQVASASVRNLASDQSIRQTLHSTMADLQAVSHDARQTARAVSAELRSAVHRNSGKIDELANGAIDLLKTFADTADAARSAVTKLSEQISDPRLQQSLQETLDLTKTTIARFGQIATDIHSITGDPNVQGDLKTSITTLRETAQEGQRLVERVSSLVGAIKTGTGRPRFGIGKPELAIDFLGRTNNPNFRSDVNLRFPLGDRNAFDLGLYDFGDRYKLNAQYETNLGGHMDLRYGVYAAKLGVGLDTPLWPSTRLALDAFNPNNLELDARALIQLNNDFSLWLGADQVFKKTTPLIGLRLQR